MNPETELHRAHELALAAHSASQLFWIIVIGGAIIIAFWSFVLWRLRRRKAKRSRETLRTEANHQASKNVLYDEIAWREFCDHNELSESTRAALMASAHGGNTTDKVVEPVR